MNINTKTALLLQLLILISVIYAQNYDVNEIELESQKLLKKRTEQGFSGTVIISINNKIILNKGYGFTDSTDTYKITPQTLFNIASITKTITATGIFQLEEKGLISTKDKISKFFKNVPPDKKNITIHQLLTHTSGLQQHYIATEEPDRDSAVAKILNDDLKFKPGTDFSYSNENYQLLAAIIEQLTTSTYENYIRKNVLNPADMNNTFFWGELNDLDASKFAQKLKVIPPEIRQRNWDFIGSNGIYTNSIDLYKFYKAFSKGKLVSKKIMRIMLQPYKKLSSTNVGYGWFISKTKRNTIEYWTRGTEDFGHNAVLRWFPEDNVVIVVCSNAGDKLGNYANQLISNDLVSLILKK
jgi:CubicO group peptidase (beta-lactamase class C family)